jgi:hypothetical protein
VAVGCVVAVLVLSLAVRAGEERVPPISRQSCAQLAETYRQIQAVQGDPSTPKDEMRRSMNDAERMNRRIDALGGCPSEPSLQ